MGQLALRLYQEQQEPENPVKVYRHKLLREGNNSSYAKIYQFLYHTGEQSTLSIMGYCYECKITSYLRRLHELKNRGFIVNRIIKTKDGKEYALWKVKKIE